MSAFAVRSRRVLLKPDLPPEPATLVVRDGRFAGESPAGLPVLDFGDSVVMPGIVDTHAHINEPGRTDWEGFETATRAAAAGGITTVIDMPLNSIPPTVTAAALAEKRRAAGGRCVVDYGFWGGVVPPHLADLEALAAAGIWGAKAFLIESGVDEFPMVREPELRAGMRILARAGLPLLVHAELGEERPAEGDRRAYRNYLASRPPEWEVNAIRLVLRLVRETGCSAHIVHLSAAEALADLAAARREGLPITVETCPHYLTLDAETIADGATHFKCAPPIREAANRERLWEGLLAGHIDFVVSDHSPCLPRLKDPEGGDFRKAWGGIAGLQFSLPVLWTEMARRGLPLERLSRWLSSGPASRFGIPRKGSLLPGADADFVVWDPEGTFTLTPERIHHRHPVTPYGGRTLHGVVQKTFLRGEWVYDGGRFTDRPYGAALLRGTP